jgi:serine/threonine-protein kinase
MELYSKVPFATKYNNDIEEIIKKLEELYKNSLLENEIQNNNKLTTIFINGMYSYYPRVVFSINNLLSIIQLLKSISQDKQKIILNHLWERFDTIERYAEKAPFDVDLPF